MKNGTKKRLCRSSEYGVKELKYVIIFFQLENNVLVSNGRIHEESDMVSMSTRIQHGDVAHIK